MRGLGRQSRAEEAKAVERAIAEAEKWDKANARWGANNGGTAGGGDSQGSEDIDGGSVARLLASDISRAREGLEAWRSSAAAEARLERALKECSGTAAVAKAVQEAAAAGVKVMGRGGQDSVDRGC